MRRLEYPMHEVTRAFRDEALGANPEIHTLHYDEENKPSRMPRVKDYAHGGHWQIENRSNGQVSHSEHDKKILNSHSTCAVGVCRVLRKEFTSFALGLIGFIPFGAQAG